MSKELDRLIEELERLQAPQDKSIEFATGFYAGITEAVKCAIRVVAEGVQK